MVSTIRTTTFCAALFLLLLLAPTQLKIALGVEIDRSQNLLEFLDTDSNYGVLKEQIKLKNPGIQIPDNFFTQPFKIEGRDLPKLDLHLIQHATVGDFLDLISKGVEEDKKKKQIQTEINRKTESEASNLRMQKHILENCPPNDPAKWQKWLTRQISSFLNALKANTMMNAIDETCLAYSEKAGEDIHACTNNLKSSIRHFTTGNQKDLSDARIDLATNLEDYLKDARQMVDHFLPEEISKNSALIESMEKIVLGVESSYSTFESVIKTVNKNRAEESQISYFGYAPTQIVDALDELPSYRRKAGRLIMHIPSQTKGREADLYLQATIKTASAPANYSPTQLSVVAREKGKDNVFILDMKRVNNEIIHPQSATTGENLTKCYSCHMGGAILLHPQSDESFGNVKLSQMNALLRRSRLLRLEPKYRREVPGALLGRKDSREGNHWEECFQGENLPPTKKEEIQNDLSCSKCHDGKHHTGIANTFWMDPTQSEFIKSYLVKGHMPPGGKKSSASAKELYECLVSLAKSDFKDWLGEKECIQLENLPKQIGTILNSNAQHSEKATERKNKGEIESEIQPNRIKKDAEPTLAVPAK